LVHLSEEARAEGRELTEEEKELDRLSIRPERKLEIWTAAIEASWGTIDLDEFERNWITFVEDYL